MAFMAFSEARILLIRMDAIIVAEGPARHRQEATRL
jgi:hypothetical protein